MCVPFSAGSVLCLVCHRVYRYIRVVVGCALLVKRWLHELLFFYDFVQRIRRDGTTYHLITFFFLFCYVLFLLLTGYLSLYIRTHIIFLVLIPFSLIRYRFATSYMFFHTVLSYSLSLSLFRLTRRAPRPRVYCLCGTSFDKKRKEKTRTKRNNKKKRKKKWLLVNKIWPVRTALMVSEQQVVSIAFVREDS